MKLKKIRVRLKDIHHGKILYVAHPTFGIEVVQIAGKPFKHETLGSLFIKVTNNYTDRGFEWTQTRSLKDMGVCNAYGYRRTFHTRKQAERYVDAMKYSPDFVRYWDDHLARCAMMDDYYMDYADH